MPIENQVEVIADGAGFCRFSSQTLAPIDLAMADLDALDPQEVAFINGYHACVCASLADWVRPQTGAFLLPQTRPVAEQRVDRT